MHSLAGLLFLLTLVLVSAGAVVTSRDAGLSVPDWPLAYGKVNPDGWWKVDNIRAEHGHRLIGATVGSVTLVFSILVFFRERRRKIRLITLLTFIAVCVQGLLGGLTVLLHLPPWVSIAHACLAQTFLCLVVSLFELTKGRPPLERTPANGSFRCPPAPLADSSGNRLHPAHPRRARAPWGDLARAAGPGRDP
jgi:cytochrome c oxidase assembly protein subunit 15